MTSSRLGALVEKCGLGFKACQHGCLWAWDVLEVCLPVPVAASEIPTYMLSFTHTHICHTYIHIYKCKYTDTNAGRTPFNVNVFLFTTPRRQTQQQQKTKQTSIIKNIHIYTHTFAHICIFTDMDMQIQMRDAHYLISFCIHMIHGIVSYWLLGFRP